MRRLPRHEVGVGGAARQVEEEHGVVVHDAVAAQLPSARRYHLGRGRHHQARRRPLAQLDHRREGLLHVRVQPQPAVGVTCDRLVSRARRVAEGRDALLLVGLAALLADQVPAGAPHAAVAAVAGPAAAVVAAAVVAFAPGRPPASRVGSPHVVRYRMLRNTCISTGQKNKITSSLV